MEVWILFRIGLHEQFEMIANVCGWSPQARLVNLVTRLEGQAYAFFRPCTTQKKDLLVVVLCTFTE